MSSLNVCDLRFFWYGFFSKWVKWLLLGWGARDRKNPTGFTVLMCCMLQKKGTLFSFLELSSSSDFWWVRRNALYLIAASLSYVTLSSYHRSCLFNICRNSTELLTCSLLLATDSFGFSNSYIWIEFYNTPLEQDVTLISDVSNLSYLEIVSLCNVCSNIVDLACLQTIRSWHIIGRMGGCNSMNMQVNFQPLFKILV